MTLYVEKATIFKSTISKAKSKALTNICEISYPNK